MRKTIYGALVVAVSLLSSGVTQADEVTVHENKFNNLQAGSGDHFYGRLMNWSVWTQSEEQSALQMPFNYVAVAEEDMGDPSLSYADFDSLNIPLIEIDEVISYFEEREIEYPEYYRTPGGAVFDSKIQIDLPDDFDAAAVDLNNFNQVTSRADSPHMHSSVSKEWVSDFLPNFHAGHDIISSNEPASYSFVVMHTGSQYYGCTLLDSALKAQSAGIGLSMFGAYRQYMINRVTSPEPSSVDSRVLEPGAKKVFRQQLIYSSNLIKSGESYIGFYEDEATGKKKLIITNSIVLTDKVLRIFTDKFINGFNARNAQSVNVQADQAILTQQNTDIRVSNSDSCGQGLGLGVASYVYNLAKKVVQGLNE